MDFYRDFDFTYDRAEQAGKDIVRITARNPKAYTWVGTNTYLVGRTDLAIIDPGPALDEHIQAVLAAVDGRPVKAIVCTHSHMDHSPAAHALAKATGAPVCGHSVLHPDIGMDTDEDIDPGFAPDRLLAHGDTIAGTGWTLEAVHTPGHFPNHLCYGLGDILFSGDHVMGWSTTVIAPPLGNLRHYLTSLEQLLERDFTYYLPSHGPAIPDPKPYIRALIAHRHKRSEAIAKCLADGITEPARIVEIIYKNDNLSDRLKRAAQHSVRAHMDYLNAEQASGLAAE